MKKKQRFDLIVAKKGMMHMWKWLSENPGKNKGHYCSKFKVTENCFSCSYNSKWHGHNCRKCIMKWWCNDNLGAGYNECTDPGSPYSEFSPKKRPKYSAVMAREIYKLAIKIKIPKEE